MKMFIKIFLCQSWEDHLSCFKWSVDKTDFEQMLKLCPKSIYKCFIFNKDIFYAFILLLNRNKCQRFHDLYILEKYIDKIIY